MHARPSAMSLVFVIVTVWVGIEGLLLFSPGLQAFCLSCNGPLAIYKDLLRFAAGVQPAMKLLSFPCKSLRESCKKMVSLGDLDNDWLSVGQRA